MKEYKILTISSRNITVNIGHKYYTQIVSQMAITETNSFYCMGTLWFICWIHTFWKKSLGNVKTNLIIFFKAYVCPTLLGKRSVTYWAKCDTVLLEESETPLLEKNKLNSIQCDGCNA